MIQRLKKSDDRGAALVLALIIVLVFAIGLSALLTFSDTSIRSTVDHCLSDRLTDVVSVACLQCR